VTTSARHERPTKHLHEHCELHIHHGTYKSKELGRGISKRGTCRGASHGMAFGLVSSGASWVGPWTALLSVIPSAYRTAEHVAEHLAFHCRPIETKADRIGQNKRRQIRSLSSEHLCSPDISTFASATLILIHEQQQYPTISQWQADSLLEAPERSHSMCLSNTISKM